jgi:segregation and condensation protein A
VAGAAGRAGAAHAPLPPLPASLLASALEGLLRIAPPPPPPAELFARAITISDCAELIRAALRTAPMIVLQELLRDVNDRVVVAVTFLALLELMKRREIVVEQAAPWGPILARAATPAERGAAGSVVSPDVPLDETLESFA